MFASLSPPIPEKMGMQSRLPWISGCSEKLIYKTKNSSFFKKQIKDTEIMSLGQGGIMCKYSKYQYNLTLYGHLTQGIFRAVYLIFQLANSRLW